MNIYRELAFSRQLLELPLYSTPTDLQITSIADLLSPAISPDTATSQLNLSPQLKSQLFQTLLIDFKSGLFLLQKISSSELPKNFYDEALLDIVFRQQPDQIFDALMVITPDFDCEILFYSAQFTQILTLFNTQQSHLINSQFLTFIIIRNAINSNFPLPQFFLSYFGQMLDSVNQNYFEPSVSNYNGLQDQEPFYFTIWSVVKLFQTGFYYSLLPLFTAHSDDEIVALSIDIYVSALVKFMPQNASELLTKHGLEYLALDQKSYFVNVSKCVKCAEEVEELMGNEAFLEFLMENQQLPGARQLYQVLFE